MSPQLSRYALQAKSFIFKSMGLSAGIALLLSSGSAFAMTYNQAEANSSQRTQLAQVDSDSDNSSADDVVVDTKPEDGTTTGSDSDVNSATTSAKRFSCQFYNGQYTVMYYPQSQPDQGYPWATPRGLGGGWTPERRCNEISRRLEFYRPEGLQEMRTNVENNYNIVCVTTQKNPNNCQIVLTVPPGQDAELTRDKVFQNISTADSGQRTDAINTFVGSRDAQMLNDLLNLKIPRLDGGRNARSRSQSINLRPFLDTADGGTATKLKGGVPIRNRSNSRPRQLNPNNFR